MEKLIEKNLEQIRRILKAHDVEDAYLFGSAAKGTMNSGSDIDFLIRFSADKDVIKYAENYFDLMYSLQGLLNREVELLEESTISSPYLLQSINSNKLPLF